MNFDPKDADKPIDPPQNAEDNHELPFVSSIEEGHEDATQFDPSLASPSVLDEENPIGRDASDSEPVDIDDALAQFGRKPDGKE